MPKFVQKFRICNLIGDRSSVERIGIEKGLAQGKADTLIRLLRRRDKALPSAIEDRVRTASIDQLDEWSERLIDGKSLAEIFDSEQMH